MGCSATKRHELGLVAASVRYDGPSFRVVRAYLATRPTEPLEIWLVSGKFGVIRWNTPIDDYDQRMTPDAAAQFAPVLQAKLGRAMRSTSYTKVLVHLGKDYLPILSGGMFPLPPPTLVDFTAGGICQRLGQLKTWLHAGS